MISVLIVDDSQIVRRFLERGLQSQPGISVVGCAPDAYAARHLLLERRPDVLVLDLQLPHISGLEFLRRLMRYLPLPVIVLSAFTPENSDAALAALAAGAVDVLCKPRGAAESAALIPQLVSRIVMASQARVTQHQPSVPRIEASPQTAATADQLLLLGASTGGVAALEQILPRLPAGGPATVVVQHMPRAFTGRLATRLDGLCAMQVREATGGERPTPGLALIAPGGRHALLLRDDAGPVLVLEDGPPRNQYRPSIDALFETAARARCRSVIGVLLTGMGADGARGLLALRKSGAHTIVQDEETSVVFGMPRVAIELGAAREIQPVTCIAGRVVELAAARAPDRPDRPGNPPSAEAPSEAPC